MTHEGENPLVAQLTPTCKKSSSCAFSLLTPTGEKPFSCTIFDKGCSQIGALRISIMNTSRDKIPLFAHYVVNALVFKVWSLVIEPGVSRKSGNHTSTAQAQMLQGLNFQRLPVGESNPGLPRDKRGY